MIIPAFISNILGKNEISAAQVDANIENIVKDAIPQARDFSNWLGGHYRFSLRKTEVTFWPDKDEPQLMNFCSSYSFPRDYCFALKEILGAPKYSGLFRDLGLTFDRTGLVFRLDADSLSEGLRKYSVAQESIESAFYAHKKELLEIVEKASE